MDRGQAIPAQPGSACAVAGNLLQRRQREYRRRQGKLFPERRRILDARQEEPGAAGLEILQANAEVTLHRRNARRGRMSLSSGPGSVTSPCPDDEFAAMDTRGQNRSRPCPHRKVTAGDFAHPTTAK